jgi:hypothetical protein
MTLVDISDKITDYYFGKVYEKFPTLVSAKEIEAKVGALVNADLTALHRKRVAREERRVWKENEYERL